ncbi:MAG TPA: pitrilysin family protein, partial [bacterium]
SWNPDVAIPTDSSFVVGRLDNGFTYYIKANRRPEKRAELRLAVNAGSVCEDDDQRGLAHFVEHMAFNGTAHFQKQELVDYMESIGMRFGPEVNASTGFDETLYQLFVPTDSLPVLEKGFLILEDWAQGVSFEDEAIDKERGVVVEEWRLGRGANARIRDRQFPVLLHGSKYADRLPIGEKAVIDTFHHETLRRFYRDWYRPDLMAVIAVGDFDPVEIEALVRRHFSNLPRPTLSRVRELYAIPDHDETLYAIASDPEATGASVSLYVKRPLEAEATLSDFRRSLIEELLDGMMNQRLDELTKSADPPFIFGLSGNGRMLRTKSVTLLSATVEENGIERGLEALLTESRRVREFGFTQTELDRQKADLLRLTERAYDEQDKTESSVFTDRAVDRFLEDRALPGAAAALRLTRLLLPTILLEDVSGFARGSITRANRVILASAPKKEGVRIPTESDIVAVAGRVEAAPLAAYLDRVSDRPLLETDLPPGRIIRTRFFPSIRTTEWTLSNGTRVVLKPTDFKNDQV